MYLGLKNIFYEEAMWNPIANGQMPSINSGRFYKLALMGFYSISEQISL